MKITEEDIKLIKELNKNSFFTNVGIEILPSEDDRIHATMPVDERTCQLFGYINGGANLAFAETIAGIGSIMHSGHDEGVVGMQVSGNHLHAVPIGGKVKANAQIIHKGKKTHVWDVTISDTCDNVVCVVRVTNYIFKLKNGAVNQLSKEL